MRRAALVLMVPLFSLFLFALAVDIGFIRVVTHPEKTKQILSDSGLYGSVVSGLLDQAKTISTTGSGNNDISLSNDLIRSAAEKSITPEFLKQNTEGFIDSIYRWLDGTTLTPDFKIDLGGVKQSFADNVASSLQQKLASLPVCPAGTSVQSYDALNATCLPKGLTAAQAASTVKNGILNGQGFLDNSTLSANDVKSSDSGQPLFQDSLKDAPKAYQNAKKSPAILALLALLTGVIVVFLSATKKKGVRKIGGIAFGMGIFMLLFAWGLNQVVAKKLPQLKFDNTVIQEKLQIVIKDIAQEVGKTYYIVGAVYAAAGAVAITGAVFLLKGGKPESKDHGPAETAKPPASDKPTPTEAATASKSSDKKKIAVQ